MMKNSKLKFSEYMQNISMSKSFGKFVLIVIVPCSFSKTYILVQSKVNMGVFFCFFTEVNLILKCIKA